MELFLVITDVDDVSGYRPIEIKPQLDQAPEMVDPVEPGGIRDNGQALNMVRKVRDGNVTAHIVTVDARVPFRGRVKDDRGLANVYYRFEMSRIETGLNITASTFSKTVWAIGLAGGVTPLSGGLIYADAVQEARKPAEAVGIFKQGTRDMPLFREEMEKSDPAVPLDRVKAFLTRADLELPGLFGTIKQGADGKLIDKSFRIRPDDWKLAEDKLSCDFPLYEFKLKQTDARQTQQRYRMKLWVEATDTDVESVPGLGPPQPHVTESNERYNFLIVGEDELLGLVALDEEKLREDLEDMFNELLPAEEHLAEINRDLGSRGLKPENLGPMSTRLDSLAGPGQRLEKLQATTRQVYEKYEDISAELRINRVKAEYQAKVNDKIVKPLKDVDRRLFPQTREALLKFRDALEQARKADAAQRPAALERAKEEGGKARSAMAELKNAIQDVLKGMEGLTSVNKLILILRKIDAAEQEQYEKWKKIKDDLERKLLEGDKP
jgi:hypothetical protein